MRPTPLEKATLVLCCDAETSPVGLFRKHGPMFFVAPTDWRMASGGWKA
jgi:hypothetical protein